VPGPSRVEREAVRVEADTGKQAVPPAPEHSDRGAARPVGESLAAAELIAPTRGLSPDDAAGVQRGIAEELMRRAGFPSRCNVIEGEYNQVRITVDSDSAAVLIGRRGSTIDAVEHLVERMANQAVGDHTRMNLDINNYRLRREGQLEANAQDAVRQMLESGKDVHTPPLCARERRIVHLAIEKIADATTYTAGFGPDRHVVVTRDEKQDGKAPGDDREQDDDVLIDRSPDAQAEADDTAEER
ncbi:KH domain-containing protein, partial [bacterium]|nr:KH domain-containing protein [bacterium]